MKKATKMMFKRWTRRLALTVLAIGLLGVCVVLYANLTAIWASRGRLFDEVSKLPQTQVGLVFGQDAGRS